MKKILFALILLLPLASVAQTPDNEVIRREISNSASKYSYPTLFARYQKADTTLTLDDYRHLYYGYAFQLDYKPLDNVDAADSVIMLFERKTDPQVADFLKLIEYSNEILRKEPFNPRHLNLLTYAYGSIGDTINERLNHRRFLMVLNAIKSSGNGLREESPYHVLYFSHPLDLLSFMEQRIGKRMVVSRSTEYISVLMPKGSPKGYYFDFSRIYWNKPDNFDSKKKPKGLEFNGLKPKQNR